VTTNDKNLPTFMFAGIRSVAFLFDEKRRKSREKKTREGDALRHHSRYFVFFREKNTKRNAT
jgi:hypothetical protein